MTLKDQLATDAISVFCNTDDFAETVTYYPHRYYNETARAAREIKAVVLRESITVLAEDGDTVAPVWQVHVANNATTGISSEELDIGGDQISLPPREGDTAERRTITRLMEHDPGMLVLECR